MIKAPQLKAEHMHTNNPLSYFYASNKILAEPQTILGLLRNFSDYSTQQQQNHLTTIIAILKSVSTNAYTLVTYQDENSKNALMYVIELIPLHLNNYLIFNLLLNTAELLLCASDLKDGIMRKAIQKNIIDFYDNKVSGSSIFSTISIIKLVMNAKLEADKDPPNMLMFDGRRGVELSPLSRKHLNWQFSQGMAFCTWIYIENIKFGNEVSLPKIFTFYSPNNGGLEAYLIDNKIFYRILGSKYTQPQIGSNGIALGQLEPRKWHFICIEHQAGKTFSKSKVNFYLNRNKGISFSIDPPRISSHQKTKYVLFDNIYCKSSSFCIFPNPIGPARVDELNKNINSIDGIKAKGCYVFESKQGYIYERSGFGYCPNYIFNRCEDMNIKLILPFFYLLRFVEENKYPILNELLSLFVIFLRKSSANQQQAANHHYLKLIGQLMKDIPTNVLDQNTIKILLHIKHTITDQILLDQYFAQFMWPIANSVSHQRQQEILEVIKSSYTLNIGHFSNIIGLDQILNSLLQLQSRSSYACCDKHHQQLTRKLDYSDTQLITGQNRLSSEYLVSLIELYFQNSKISYPEQSYKICRVLTLKLSPCLLLSLMALLKKIVSQKLNEKLSEDQAKKIIKIFMERKVYLILLHVIENNLFGDVKAESVKFIYSILLKKVTHAQQLEICQRISRALAVTETSDQCSPEKSILKTPKFFKTINASQLPSLGPQPPLLSNRISNHKKFQFQMFSNQQMMEEEKTVDNEASNNHQPSINTINPVRKPPMLSINTDAINEMYTFGGEKGQQIAVSEQQEFNQIEKIRRLAKICAAKMRGQQPIIEERVVRPMAALPSTRNKPLQVDKTATAKLKLISEVEEEESVEQTPKNIKSAKSPNLSINNEQSQYLIYNSLMESCLGLNFYNSQPSKIQIPSLLVIFFSWIPQTDLEVKFINDIEIITESSENMQLITQMPEFYDFLLELLYKALVFEDMQQKKVYVEKLQSLIKSVCAYIFQEDANACSKFSFMMDWSISKGQEYHPKCLFLAGRYFMLLFLESIEQFLIMNISNHKTMEKNFQALGSIVESLMHFNPCPQVYKMDEYDRVLFGGQHEIVPSMLPYFKSRWADCLICQKYMFLFKKFYCTEWYLKGLKSQRFIEIDWLKATFEQQSRQNLIKEASYYLKTNFIVSILEIHKAVIIEAINSKKINNQNQLTKQGIWLTVALLILIEINKDKNQLQHKSELIRCILKSCKIFSQLQIKDVVLIPKAIKNIQKICTNNQKSTNFTTNLFVDQLARNYIPQWILDENISLESFRVAFAEVWAPSEMSFKKTHSELFKKFHQKYLESQQIIMNSLEIISNILEEEKERQRNTFLLIKISQRISRNQYRKLWRSLRIFGSPWTHPQLTWQNDILCNRAMFSYQKYKPSQFYKLKVAKHLSKSKARFLLKTRLVEPEMAEQRTDDQQIQSQQLYLHRAICASSKMSLGKSLLYWLHSDQQLDIIMQFKKVRIVNTLTVRNGHFGIINDKLIFVASNIKQNVSHLAISQYRLRQDKSFVKLWPLELIKQINRRRFLNRQRGVQIIFIQGKSIFLQFDEEDADDFCKKILKMKNTKCSNLMNNKSLEIKKIYQNQALLKKWNSYQMTNFQYLMELNHISGRSYSDVTQFPVFPWVLINFGAKLVLSDPNNYRNLNYPMGAIGTPQRTNVFRQRFQMMPLEEKGATKFHYGTHYSSPGIVYHFLVRLSPFTEGGILLQGGKFDFADRLFYSMADSFKNATSQYSDVRQLLPQMYTIPEVYLNLNKNDFGIMQNKKRVHNVELPQWAKQNPYLFITKMRRSLQQSCISSTINNWIDLIFGYKQRGQQAINSLNCFYYLTYQDSVDFSEIRDEKSIKAIQSQILNFGQTPSQIFTKPHPERTNLSMIIDFFPITDSSAEVKVYRPSKGKNISGQQMEVNPLFQVGESIVKMKWFKDSKLIFLRRNGEMTCYKWHTSNLNARVPFQCSIEKQKKIQRVQKSLFDPNEYYDLSLKVERFPVEFINSGHVIVLGGLSDGKIVLIDTDSNHVIQTQQFHSGTVSCLQSDSKDNFLISGDVSGQVNICRINSSFKLNVIQQYHDHQGQITSIFISYELRCFASASKDGSVYVYNIITGKLLRMYYHPRRLPVDHVIITTSPLAAVVIFSNAESIIYCYSLNGQLIQRVHEKDMEYFMSPVIIKDFYGFEHLVYGNEHGEIIFRTLPFLDDPKKHIVAKQALVNQICISRNCRFLISGCSDGELSVITDPNLATK